jgi:acyl transferase domain-containing protein
MMSIGLGENDVLHWIGKEDSPAVGCINSPINVTLTGSKQSRDRLWHRLDRAEIFAWKLDVSIACHSKAMKAGSSAYLAAIRDIKSPPLPARKMQSSLQPVLMYSSITGNAITIPEVANPAYWVKNLVSPVHFADAISAMLTPGNKRTSHSIVENSPKPALCRPIHDTADCILAKDKYQYLPTLQDKSSHAKPMLQLLGHLWSCGLNVDIGVANAASSTTLPELLPDLPAYSFSRSKQYWQESRLSRNVSFRPFRRHGLLGLRAQDWNAADASWRHKIRVQENPWVLDHGVGGKICAEASHLLTYIWLNGSSICPGSACWLWLLRPHASCLLTSRTRLPGVD